jgi:hypothetical protein
MGLSAVVLPWPGRNRTFESNLVTWDAGACLSLSKEGYEQGNGICTFYPLFPMLIRWIPGASGQHFVITGMSLANFLSFVGFILFFDLCADAAASPPPPYH